MGLVARTAAIATTLGCLAGAAPASIMLYPSLAGFHAAFPLAHPILFDMPVVGAPTVINPFSIAGVTFGALHSLTLLPGTTPLDQTLLVSGPLTLTLPAGTDGFALVVMPLATGTPLHLTLSSGESFTFGTFGATVLAIGSDVPLSWLVLDTLTSGREFILQSVELDVIPEPAMLPAFAGAIGLLLAWRRRR